MSRRRAVHYDVLTPLCQLQAMIGPLRADMDALAVLTGLPVEALCAAHRIGLWIETDGYIAYLRCDPRVVERAGLRVMEAFANGVAR